MTYTYKLTSGKKKGLVQLPTKGMLAIKEVKMLDGSIEKMEKPIQYVKGANSIFVEDQPKDAKVGKVWFEDGFLSVNATDWALNEYIRNTKRFGYDYVLLDEEKDSAKKISDKKKRLEVENIIINETDINKLRAMAMVLISLDARNWGENKCRESLLNLADTDINAVIKEQAKPGYESRLLAAEAYVAGIIKDNATHTEIVWADSQGVILRLAQGENGIDKLGNFFSEGSDAAVLVMQEIGERAQRKISQLNYIKRGLEKPAAPGKSEEQIRAELQAEYDAKLEALRTELLGSNNASLPATEPEPTVPVTTTADYNPEDLMSVREQYKKLVGNIPPNMNNNIKWLNEKIAEKQK